MPLYGVKRTNHIIVAGEVLLRGIDRGSGFPTGYEDAREAPYYGKNGTRDTSA